VEVTNSLNLAKTCKFYFRYQMSKLWCNKTGKAHTTQY